MIEAFDEVADDAKAVEDCKVWLLKQKQTQDWKTTKATADAVYALLLRGTDLLASSSSWRWLSAARRFVPKRSKPAPASTSKFRRRRSEPEDGHITVKKTDAGVAWGSVHWQYLEDIDKVTLHDGTPLKLRKSCTSNATPTPGRSCSVWKARSKSVTNWSCGWCCAPIATWNTCT